MEQAFLKKCERKTKGQSRRDNPNTLATLGTQDTVQRQIKKIQHRKQKWKEQQGPHQTQGVNPGVHEG